MPDGNPDGSANFSFVAGIILAVVGVALIASTISLSLVAMGLLVDIAAIVFLHRGRKARRMRAESTRPATALLVVCYLFGSVTVLVFGALGLATWWK